HTAPSTLASAGGARRTPPPPPTATTLPIARAPTRPAVRANCPPSRDLQEWAALRKSGAHHKLDEDQKHLSNDDDGADDAADGRLSRIQIRQGGRGQEQETEHHPPSVPVFALSRIEAQLVGVLLQSVLLLGPALAGLFPQLLVGGADLFLLLQLAL